MTTAKTSSQKFLQIRQELSMMFGALTISPLEAPFKGTWTYGGVQFTDDIFKIEIITDDERGKYFFQEFKLRLMKMLDQLDILITVHGIDTI